MLGGLPRAIRLPALFCVWAFFSLPAGSTAAGETKAGWQADWEKTLQAAKAEGRVVLYAYNQYDEFFREFEKKFPEIKVSAVISGPNEIIQRIMAERRAGRYIGDLFIGGANSGYNALYKGRAFDPLKPLLVLPEVVDLSKWWKGEHRYIDEEREYLLSFNGVALPFVGYNSKLVKPAEFKSYADLLNPKWKGKIVAFDPTSGSSVDTALFFLHSSPGLGPEYLRRLLSEMDLTPTRDGRQITDWLGSGRFAISMFTTIGRVRLHDAKAQGLPVDWFGPRELKEGVPLSTSSGNVGLLNRAPHPNAAKVLVNWMLSREGQIAYQKVFGDKDSLRIDIPKDNVGAWARRVEGATYIHTDSPEGRDMEPVRRIVNEVWKKR
jgi:ABC-type Fe3+ transport system substrate-binding protein